jgi:hypothetical protein
MSENFRNFEFELKFFSSGVGNPEPKTLAIFDGLTESQGYYTSKGFLPKVCIILKIIGSFEPMTLSGLRVLY